MEPYLRLEKELEKWSHCSNVVSCSSGTAALHLGLESLNLPRGSEIIVPDFSMIACPRAVVMAGHTPVFVDCDQQMNIDTNIIKLGITNKTRAIMVVHTYGRSVCMDSIMALAYSNDLYVIEDLAEIHGKLPHRSTDVACWSFYKNKIVAGEEGGAVAFLEPEFADRARQLKNLGFTNEHDFIHISRGHNYRMSNLHAQPILESLSRFRANIEERREQVALCDSLCPPEYLLPQREFPWVYDLIIPGLTYESQTKLVKLLVNSGINARHAFKPNISQPEFYQNSKCIVHREHNAYKYSKEVIYLPLGNNPRFYRAMEKAFEIITDFVV